MAISKNSLTTLLNDLVRIQMNASEIVNELSKAVSSNSDTVELDLMDGDNTFRKVTIPSYSGIKSQIDRLDQSLKSMSGLGDTNATIKLADGSFRKIISNSLKKEAANIETIQYPSEFSSRENHFFESFLNPLLYVTFNFQGQMKPHTERAEVLKFILTLDTNQKLDYFNNNWKTVTTIDYNQFMSDLGTQNIEFIIDSDVVSLPPRVVRYSGDFSVTRIFEEQTKTRVNGEDVKKKELKFKLNKLTYNDKLSSFSDTQQLKVGDSIVLKGDLQSTKYRITSIEASTLTIGVKKIEGYGNIAIGENNISFYPEGDDAITNVNVNIGLSERSVVFVRPIDPDSNISAIKWSPGVGFYTNDLTISNKDGSKQSLVSYYQEEVADFGQFLLSGAREGIPPSSLAEIPNVPALIADNFKVLQINKHSTDNGVISEIKKLHEDKQTIDSEIKQLQTAISALRLAVNTTKYKSQIQKDGDKNRLTSLISEKDSKSRLFASIINDINTKATSKDAQAAKPKFRLRGFWPMPLGVTADATGVQEVIQFEGRYRYVSIGGGSNSPEQIEFTDNDGTKRRGTASPWISFKTDIRKREFIEDKTNVRKLVDGVETLTPVTKKRWQWVIEDVESADTPNINMIDLSINEGEGIEFQVKSISEAGWPNNPMMSDWSALIRVDFPDELSSQFSIDKILEETKNEEVRVKLIEELDAKGLDLHLSGSFSSNDNYYAHTALELASGFVSNEQKPISIFEKFQLIDNELKALKDLIERAKGSLVVKITNQLGEEIKVVKNSTVKLNAGNYVNETSSLTIKKGVIIQKEYFIKIENESASNLELWSLYYGTADKLLPNSYLNGSTFISSADEYNRELKYDVVPIGLIKPESIDLATKPWVQKIPNASRQVSGQFINSRYTSIEGSTSGFSNLYSKIEDNGDVRDLVDGQVLSFGTTDSLDNLEYVIGFGGDANTNSGLGVGYIWNMETFNVSPFVPHTLLDTNPLPNDYDTSLYVHKDHPLLKNPDYYDANQTNWKREVRMSKLSNLEDSHIHGKKQTAFSLQTNAPYTNKIGFKPEDQYLLGGDSCGAYLYLGPRDHEFIRVNGSTRRDIRDVKFGSANSINIPLIFQYRMSDYSGVSDTGIGFIGGKGINKINQLTYTKKLGIDLFYDKEDIFRFDVEVSAQYRSTTFQQSDVPVRTIQNATDDANAANNSAPKIN